MYNIPGSGCSKLTRLAPLSNYWRTEITTTTLLSLLLLLLLLLSVFFFLEGLKRAKATDNKQTLKQDQTFEAYTGCYFIIVRKFQRASIDPYMTCVNEQSDHDVLFISLQSFECTIYLGPVVQN